MWVDTLINVIDKVGDWTINGIKNWNGLDELKTQTKGKFQSSLYNANEAIRTAENYYNQTKTKISNTYGSDVFSMLEQQYNNVNNISKKNITTKDKISLYDTDAGLRDVSADFDTNYENHSLSIEGMAQKDGNIVNNLFNQLSSGDSALAQELRMSGNQLQAMLGQAQDEVDYYYKQYGSQIGQANTQNRAQMITNAENVASARSATASSGIRNTGTGTASENLARLQADLTEATMAFQIKSQAEELKYRVKSVQTSASLSAYQSRANMEITKRQALESAVSYYAEGTNTAEQYQNVAKQEVENAQEYKKQYEDYEDVNWFDRLIGNY